MCGRAQDCAEIALEGHGNSWYKAADLAALIGAIASIAIAGPTKMQGYPKLSKERVRQ